MDHHGGLVSPGEGLGWVGWVSLVCCNSFLRPRFLCVKHSLVLLLLLLLMTVPRTDLENPVAAMSFMLHPAHHTRMGLALQGRTPFTTGAAVPGTEQKQSTTAQENPKAPKTHTQRV